MPYSIPAEKQVIFLASLGETPMALGYFHLVVEGKLVPDRVGEEFSTPAAAAKRASTYIASIKSTELGSRLDFEACLVEVVDAFGRTVVYVPFSETQ